MSLLTSGIMQEGLYKGQGTIPVISDIIVVTFSYLNPNGSWTTPDNIYDFTVECTGNGGNALSAGGAVPGAGGGGYALTTVTNPTPGLVYNYTLERNLAVGDGVDANFGGICIGYGGKRGVGTAGGVGGTGFGDVTYNGGNGGSNAAAQRAGGGGAGNAGNGASTTTQTGGVGGVGNGDGRGADSFGGGLGAQPYGGGGAGGSGDWQGGGGIILIEYRTISYI